MRRKAAGLMLAFLFWLVPVYASPAVVDQVATAEKVVALTIEDIDGPAELEELLAVLARENGKATFFVPARLAAGLPLRKAGELGHELGNHSMNHGYWGPVSQTEIAKDVAEAAGVLQKAGGVWPRLIRPPYDWYGENFFQAIAALPQPVTVIRGAETGDWLKDTPEAMLAAAAASAKPGAILNINMRFKAAATALPRIVHQLGADGYRLVTVSELIKKGLAPEPPKPAEPPKTAEPAKPAEPVKPGKTPVAFGVFSRLPASGPYVALTFDDGGSVWQVRRILDALRDANVKATFFLLGDWAAANPDLVREIAAAGHEIANHSYSHPSLVWLNEEEMKSDIEAAQQILSGLSKEPVRLFRPPYGAYNSSVLNVVRELGLAALVMWDVDTWDWTGSAAGTISYRVLTGVSPGSIVLFHLHGAHTAEALGEIIPDLKERGFVFTTVSELLIN